MSLPQIFSTQTESPPSPDVVAGHIKRAGMGDVAAILLHAFKPLAWVGGQMLWILQPFVEGPGVGKHMPLSAGGLAKLLEREDGVDELVERLSDRGDEGLRTKDE